MRQTRYGAGLPTLQSRTTVLLVEPSLGYNRAQPETDIDLGQTPETINFLMRDGALEPRSRLSTVPANTNPLGNTVTGGTEVVSSVGTVYPLISGTTRLAYYSSGSWSALSYVSAGGIATPPSGITTDYYDITQSYYATSDEMVAILACQSYQTLFCWSAGTTIFSTITNAPRARYVTTSDNFVLALNSRDSGSAQSRYVQRVSWSDRGGPLTWVPATTNLAGFEDLLSAKGEGTRIMDLDNRVIVFFEGEIWQGVRNVHPNTWQFTPIDRTIGTAYSWTIAKTPVGLIFLGADFMLYLLPKDGGTAQAIGKAVQKTLRDIMDVPTLAHAVYDEGLNSYRMFYAIRGGTGVPTRELVFNLVENSIALQDYGTRSLTRAFPAYLQSATDGLTWGSLVTAGYTWGTLPYTWGQMASSSTRVNKSIFVGSSSGTVYHLSSTWSNDESTRVESRWRSGALGAANPELTKFVNVVRVDCAATQQSNVTVRVSRDQGITFDPGQMLTVPATSQETQITAFVQTPSRYPMIEMTTEDPGVRLYRAWLQMRMGGDR